MKRNITSYLNLSMAMFLAGSTVVAGKFMINIPIFISQTISLIFAIIVIFPIALKVEGLKSIKLIQKKDWLLLFLQGFTGIFLFRIFILLGLRMTSAIESGIIMSTTPALLALFSFVFLKEKIEKQIKIGILITILGLVALNTNAIDYNISGTWISLVGNFFILLAVVGEVLFTIFRKLQSYHSNPLITTAFVILFAFICFLPVGISQAISYNWNELTIYDLIPMFYYGVMCSAFGYICWFKGISKVNVSVVAGFSGLMPISSVILSLIILKEALSLQHVIGMLLILGGIVVITKVQNCTTSNYQGDI